MHEVHYVALVHVLQRPEQLVHVVLSRNVPLLQPQVEFTTTKGELHEVQVDELLHSWQLVIADEHRTHSVLFQ